MPSYQVKDQCYSTVQAGVTAYISQMPVMNTNAANGSCPYVGIPSVVSWTSTGAVVNYAWVKSGSCPNLAPTGNFTINLQPCGLIEPADALILSWSVAGCWIVVYALRYLRKVWK